MLTGSYPSGKLDIDLGILVAGQTEPLLDPLCPLVLGIWLAKRQFFCTSIQPRKMRCKLERASSIGANDFVDGISELETPIVDGNGRLLPGKETAVDECDVGHWLNFRMKALLLF
jgi:hypothetical protein